MNHSNYPCSRCVHGICAFHQACEVSSDEIELPCTLQDWVVCIAILLVVAGCLAAVFS